MKRLRDAIVPAGRGRRAVMALCSALLVLVAGYFIDSLPYAVGGEISSAQWLERLGRMAGVRGENLPDSVLLVNVAFDKTLIAYDAPVSDDPSESVRMPAGRIDVTDRRKLADFLEAASDGEYRYMMLDIRFDDGIRSDSDAMRLFSLIGGMPRVVYARHEDSPTTPEAPSRKGAYSDYHTTMTETGMVKYPLFKADGPSIPLRMYEDLHGGRMSSFCGIPVYDGVPGWRSIYLTYPVVISGWAGRQEPSGLYGTKMKFNYLNLGQDLLSKPDSADLIRERTRGRIVVVGDFVNDRHDTYIGSMAGPLINLNAYIALCRGRHKVSPLPALVLLAIYFLISYTLLSRWNLLDRIGYLRRHRSTLLRVVVSFVGFSTMLGATAIVFYLVAGVIYSVVFPSIYFTFFNLWIQKRCAYGSTAAR